MGLIENLSFARDRSVECFLWSIGTTFDLQYGLLRKALAKAVNLILVIDDIYDIYGSWDELQQFTNAVDRLVFKILFESIFRYFFGGTIIITTL